MDDLTFEESIHNNIKYLEDLPPSEVRELRKEYYKTVYLRIIFLRILAIFLVLAGAALGGSFLFSLAKSVFSDKGTELLWWGLGALFAPICSLSIVVMAYIHNGFARWLWNEKDILSKDWTKRKGSAEAGKQRIYKKLTKDKRRALRREFSGAADPNDKKTWRATATAYLFGVVIVVGFMVFGLIQWIFFTWNADYVLFAFFWLVSISLSLLFVFVYPVIYIKYLAWLEYEKNIKTR